MKEYNDLDSNGDLVHSDCIDFDYKENTRELSDIFEDSDIDQYINKLNNWD